MEKLNKSIQCSVEDCRYHCKNHDYCSLDTVHIGTHEHTPETEKCPDCLSFSAKTETI